MVHYVSHAMPPPGELWFALLVSVMVWGTILWLLQRTWWWLTGGRKVRYSTSLLYGWGVLVEQACTDPSVSISAQVLLGWWLLFCLVITTGFRSSLIAHLTVQEKSRPLETLEELLEQDNWNWGTESSLFKGSVVEYFTTHEDAVVREITKKMEVLDPKEALQKVLAGRYSLIAFKYVISEVIAIHFTDSRGQTPFYISNQGFYVLPVLGWGFRKGSPYTSRFNQQMLRLEAAGLTSYWTDDVIATLERKTRAAASLGLQAGLGHTVHGSALIIS
ncbi:glutamate receptor ionotropic, delta-2-like [Panulirus ornatus]|uniref:glutamate receptor ionotropic, delta-2-like n=1 Tax=Panulirus ornatus TaxID=150431 RepID=UPI003A89E910